ncbi:RNA polymerase sigma factor [Caulobacter sp. BE254]|uniref:RNA polymerase sigma factor n=1 Tax=Caulobacter sp. BE254 TaxID=2817720 RepID=UPI002859D91F|nr:RNA polymerase sigma factor [Caulobacter sp. BE254]MDR7117358.1 RNA polymerase sigma-70 factor (ECF subfamily) [Caulobacter sp. BE254]
MDGFTPPAPTRQDLAHAVEILFRRYDDWLRGVLRKRYGDMADDLAHEAYLRTAPLEAAGEVRHHKAFLLRVADNLARDRLRKVQRESDHATHSEPFTAQSTAPSQEHALALKQIVLALPEELRDVFVLTHIQGLTYREIARLRDIPERTVKDRMRRALARTSAAMRD